MFTYVGGDSSEKGLTRDALGHSADIPADQLHSQSTVGAEQAVPVSRLCRRPVDDGDEVRGYDDAVLAFLFRVFRNEALLDDCHDI